MKKIAQERNLKVIDIRLAQIDEVELNGFPDLSGEVATYKQFDIFPTEDTPIPEGYDGWLLFFDELTSADKNTQGAAYKIILDRMVGQKKLHPKAFSAAAGNLLTDRAVVNNMSTAMSSRLIHINMGEDKNEWLEWAFDKGFAPEILSFVEWKSDALNNFKPDFTGDTYACQRTWEFANNIFQVANGINHGNLALFIGTIGQAAAREFLQFCELKNELVSFDDIIRDPENANVPQDSGKQYAISSVIVSDNTKETMESALVYIERLLPEIRLTTMRQLVRKDKSIITIPAVRTWFVENGKEWLKS